VHGGKSEVCSDVEAFRGDLAWLEANRFTRLVREADGPINPGPFSEPTGREETRGSVHGGYPSLADPAVFRRVFTLLRHILKHPFDAPSGAGFAPGLPPYRHLIDRLSDIDGSYKADQEATLRKNLEGLLRLYGFAPEVKGRPDSRRQGYAIGSALLSADQLLEVHSLLKTSMERLSDASQKPLLLLFHNISWYLAFEFDAIGTSEGLIRTPQVFQLIREEPNRFPPEHTAHSRPIPGHSSWSQGPLDTLGPNRATDSHPYPVELLLPRRRLEFDWDLRAWLFRWGSRRARRKPPGAQGAASAAGQRGGGAVRSQPQRLG
jgi:hypothetical protein